MFLTRLDRVVASVGGKIVPDQQINVYQALDPSIIKTIDVHEGDEVKAGQLLATLDPTFAAADVQQISSKSLSLKSQVARNEAELSGRALEFQSTADPTVYGISSRAKRRLQTANRAVHRAGQ